MDTPETEGSLLDAKQAAKYIGLTPYAVSRWAQEGKLAHVKLGSAKKSPLRFRRQDLDVFIARHLVPAKGEEGRTTINGATKTTREGL